MAILDEFGRPIPSKHADIIALMNRATEDAMRSVNEAIYRSSPVVLDQFGRNVLPPDPNTLSGFIEVLKNHDTYSWGGAKLQPICEYSVEKGS